MKFDLVRCIERFFNTIEIKASGCWEWQGALDKNGYGKFRARHIIPYSPYGAHRFMWELINNRSAGKLFVCHKCNNTSCCNPVHLFLGTAIQNAQDAHNDGLFPKELTSGQIKEIQQAYHNTPIRNGKRVSYARVFAIKYGVSRQVVDLAARGKYKTRMGV